MKARLTDASGKVGDPFLYHPNRSSLKNRTTA